MSWIDLDSFAGGGGASTGMRHALEKPVDIAINHSDAAIAMHTANHPSTRHYCESIWTVDPREACRGRKVRVAWFSPDCTHFSRAAGGKPRSKEIRGLAGVVIEWAKAVKPRVILLENVREFQDWGPLDDAGFPIQSRKGEDFRAWLGELTGCGYHVEFRTLVASRFGAPTSRTRFYLVARADGQRVRWPEPTHGEGTLQPVRTAAEIIDWSMPCPSIFGRKKPLAEATLRRVAAGLKRYVIESPRPFVVPGAPPSDARALTLVQTGYGERKGQAPRALDPRKPLTTVVSGGKHALVTAFLAKHYGGVVGHGLNRTIGTVTTTDHHSIVTATGNHLAEVRAFLVAYYGSEREGQSMRAPLRTVPTKDRFGLVTVHGVDYQIADIGLRMLSPRELFNAQGFPPDYRIDIEFEGRPMTKTLQNELAGNSVCPQVAAALVGANTHERWEAVA